MSAPPARRYQPGWIALAGTLLGALAGALSGDTITWFPASLAAGLALGAGIDSLVNYWVNRRDGG